MVFLNDFPVKPMPRKSKNWRFSGGIPEKVSEMIFEKIPKTI